MGFSNEEIQREWVTNSLTHEEYEQGLTVSREFRSRHRMIKRAIDNLNRALNPCGMTEGGTFDKGNDCAGTKGTGKKAEKKLATEAPAAKPLDMPLGKGAERAGVKYMDDEWQLPKQEKKNQQCLKLLATLTERTPRVGS